MSAEKKVKGIEGNLNLTVSLLKNKSESKDCEDF